MKNEIIEERKNKQKSWRTSLLLHSSVILLAFFFGCPVNKAVDPNYQIAVTFESKEITLEKASNSVKAQAEEGKVRKQAEPIKKVESKVIKDVETKPVKVVVPTPTPTPPTPTEPIISETTVEEEVEVVAVEEEIEMDIPEMEEIPEEPAPVEEEVVEDEPTEVTGGGTRGSDSDEPSDGKPSVLDGDGTGKGNSGDGDGDDGSGDDDDSGIGTGGAGYGEYDDSGNGVFGRRVIYRNTKKVLDVGFENQEGKVISAKFCVNRAGKITYAEILEDESNAIIPFGKDKDVLRGIYGYKLEADLRAPKEECGKLTIRIQQIDAIWGGE